MEGVERGDEGRVLYFIEDGEQSKRGCDGVADEISSFGLETVKQRGIDGTSIGDLMVR